MSDAGGTAGDGAPPKPALPAPWLQWLILAVCSLALAALLHRLHVPGALLIGPLIVGVVGGASCATVRIAAQPAAFSQALIGCLIAASIEIETVAAFLRDWPIFLASVLATVAASSLLGWMVSRWGDMPGTTAVWGSAPGAATAMVLMAEAFGADARLVAFMQYLRMIIVTLAAALIAGLFVDTSGIARPEPEWFPAILPGPFATTIAVALAGMALGRLARLPSPAFMGALILGVALHLAGYAQFQLPEWLLALCYATVGWTIGLKFDRAILAHAWRALPQIVGSIVALMTFCGALAWLLSATMGVDPLTAYLATSPGGMDSIAIIAAASGAVDLSFIMTLQMGRFLFVLLFGPAISRAIARRVRT